MVLKDPQIHKHIPAQRQTDNIHIYIYIYIYIYTKLYKNLSSPLRKIKVLLHDLYIADLVGVTFTKFTRAVLRFPVFDF